MNIRNLKVGLSIEGKNRRRRATYAIRALRREIEKHLRTTNYVFDNSVNDFIWARGKAESPTQIELTIAGDKKLRIFLANSEPLKDYLEKAKEKNEAKKEEKKEAPKESQKKEPLKEEAPKEAKKEEPRKKEAEKATPKKEQVKKTEKKK